ncbi:uncharacterized protein LOC130012554 [Patella vulgata]|uniref:uncharacterized protein LOC130012554 n=1 Tax=Patella vulgata TaxID=6465 RepID=UPI0024A94DF4|nr:uncharacterized protein LOC130012554 [Patella vulgata]
MDIDTVNAQTYREFPLQKRVAKRPTSSDALKGTGNFEDHTGYNDVYREHKIAPRESMKKNDYVPPDGKFDGETTSRLDYPGQTVPKRESFKPSGDALKSDDPFDAYTGYKNTYVEHPLQPKQGRRRDEYQPPTETMDSLSTNKQNFQGLTVAKRKSYKRDTEAFRSDEPIDDSTTSALDYKGYTAQRPEIKRQTGNLKPEGDMDIDTVNAQTYREFPLQKRVAKRPTSSDALKGTGNFEGYTGYNDVYREHKIVPRESMKKNDYIPPEGKFDGETTSRLDYPGQTVPKRESFKPSGDALKSDDPFDAYTGYKNTYVEHPLQPKQGRRRDEYQPPTETMDSLSTNKQDFQGLTVAKRKSYKRDTETFRSDEPIDDSTTSALDYKGYTAQRPEIKRQTGNLKPEGDMDIDTVNAQTYREFPLQKRVAKRPTSSDALKGTGNFDGHTGYNDVYREHKIAPRESMKKNDYVPPDGKFDGETTSRLDYPGQSVPKRQSFKPSGDALKSEDPFDANTGYKNTYVEHPLQPKQGRRRDEYQPPTETMDSLSTNKQDFQGLTVPKRKNYKRDTEAFKSDEPIDDSTTSALDYKAYTTQRPEIKRQTGNLKPEGDMDIDTVNAQTYREFPSQKRVAKRPTSSDALKGTGNFDGHTGYNDVYREHKIAPRESMKKNDYVPPDAKFDGETTSRLDYPGQSVPKRQSFKPSGDALKSEDPFDANTGYKNTYVEHPLQPKQGRRRDEYQPPTETMDSLSTNKQDFQGLTVAKRKSYKRDTEAFRSDEPIDDSTTSALDYKGYTAQRPEIKRQTGNLKPEGDMYIDTVNAQTYREFPLQKRVARRPTSSDALKGSGHFEGLSGYNDVYKEHKLTPRETTKKNDYVPPEGKFEAYTTSQLDYSNQPVSKRQSFKPSGDALKSEDPFDANTGYKNTFVEHPIQPKQGRRRDEYQPPTEIIDSISTNRQDFQGLTVPKRKSYKRDTEAFRSDEPIDDSTTSALDYKEHTTQRPEIKKQAGNLKLEGDMDIDTVNAQTYREVPLNRSVAKRPASSDALKGTGNFEGLSGYNDVYKEHKITPRESMRKNEYHPPEVKFEGETTSRLDYTGQTVAKRGSFRPVADSLKSDQPFDSFTENRDAYIQHNMPAKKIRSREVYLPPSEPMETVSTNKQDFLGIPVQKRQSYKRDTEPYSSGAPLDDATTFAQDFKTWAADRPAIKSQVENLKLEGDMDLYTVNQHTYRGEIGAKRSIKKCGSSNALAGDGKFHGASGYGASFQEYDLKPRQSLKKVEYVAPEGKFEGETTSKLDYQHQPPSKRTKIIPVESFPKSHDPFAPNTGYQETYVRHQVAAKILREKEQYVPPTVPLESVTTNKQDYQSVAAPKRTGFGPTKEPFRSDAPFDGNTTARGDYKQWAVDKALIKRQDTYVKSNDPMDLQTTSNISYRGEPIRKRSGKRPRSSNTLKYDGKFHGESIYRDSFTQQELPAKEVYKKQQYVPPLTRFEGETTSRVDFGIQPLSKTKNFKTTESALRSSAPMIADSIYKDSFAQPPVTARPKRDPQVYIPSSVPFEGISTSRSDFLGNAGEKRVPYRPTKEAFQSNARFDGTTTFSSDFKGALGGGRPQRILRETYQANTAPFDGSTTSRDAFTGQKGVKPRSFKPSVDSFLKSTEKFDGSSTYRGSFETGQSTNWSGPQTILSMA